jgi:hypothetical protein
MTKRTAYLAAAAIVALGTLASPGAQAKYVAVFSEVDSNVEESGHGTLDLTDLTRANEFDTTNVPAIDPPRNLFFSGAEGPVAEAYTGSILAPSGFGSGPLGALASAGTGDPVGVQGAVLFVPFDYVSGDPLSESSLYRNASFASLGMTPGKYVWSWGVGDHADTFTLQIGGLPSPVPELSTWVMMLLGFTGLSYATVRCRGRLGSTCASIPRATSSRSLACSAQPGFKRLAMASPTSINSPGASGLFTRSVPRTRTVPSPPIVINVVLGVPEAGAFMKAKPPVPPP